MRTSGEAVPQAPANHSIKEERDQKCMYTQVTANYDKRRDPCGKINCEDKSVRYYMDIRACSCSSKKIHSSMYSSLRYISTTQYCTITQKDYARNR